MDRKSLFNKDLMAVLSAVLLDVDPAQSKVGNLEPAILTDEQVGRLQVPEE